MKRKVVFIFFAVLSFYCFSNENSNEQIFADKLNYQSDYIFKQGDISICNYIFSIYSSGYKPYYDELGERVLTGDSIYSYFYLESIEGEEIIFESNEFSHESMNHLSESKILFNDSLKFCIINKKRGFVIPYQIKNKEVITKFYYWSPSEQKYILDESVTQEQIKNAWCPEDYFAYNGLRFSKLDSKLTEEDLKELDKAQLRIMRNAVYARHGRTFKGVDLQSLWECYTWYKKNPNYNDSLLSDTDKYNINLIQKYESK